MTIDTDVKLNKKLISFGDKNNKWLLVFTVFIYLFFEDPVILL
jgi:hypothetical protein